MKRAILSACGVLFVFGLAIYLYMQIVQHASVQPPSYEVTRDWAGRKR